jgi:hypothetical protein
VAAPESLDDEGLFEERTQLAWSRSAIAVLVCVTVLLRRIWPLDRADHVLALLLAAVGLLVWVVGWLLARRATTSVVAREEAALAPSTLRALSIGTFVLALAGFVLGLFPPPPA